MKSLETMSADELREMAKKAELQFSNMAKQEKKNKAKSYRHLNKEAIKGQILFTGSSLMEQFPIQEIAMSDGLDKVIYNRGISGSTTDDFLEEIDAVLFDLKPSKIFINIGTNDFDERNYGKNWKPHLLENYEDILCQIKERLPEAAVLMMAYYPVNDDNPGFAAAEMLKTRTNENLNQVNRELETLAAKYGYQFIDVNDGLKDERGKLRLDLTVEGIHMYANAYQIIYKNLKPYL